MDTYLIKLPWPEKALWENRNANWRDKARAKRLAKTYAWGVGLQSKLPKSPDAKLRFSWHPPARSRPDPHNLPATQKAAIDGLALAMGVDDRGFEVTFDPKLSERVPGGKVMVEITPVTVLIEHRGLVG